MRRDYRLAKLKDIDRQLENLYKWLREEEHHNGTADGGNFKAIGIEVKIHRLYKYRKKFEGKRVFP